MDGQSLFDIAIQALGDISGVFDLAEKADVSVTDELKVGQVFEIPSQARDKQIVDYYAAHRITPATAIATATPDDDDILPEGIGFWGIEYDFVVS